MMSNLIEGGSIMVMGRSEIGRQDKYLARISGI